MKIRKIKESNLTCKIHIHKVVQMHNCSYKAVRNKYGAAFDEKGMIDIEVLKGRLK